MSKLPELSKAELDILRALWNLQEASVREVHDYLELDTGWAYTTTKTIMDRMTAKNLINKNKFHGVFVYSTQISKPQGLARFIHFFTNKIFESDKETVLSMFSGGTNISKAELTELKKLLKELEKEDRNAE